MISSLVACTTSSPRDPGGGLERIHGVGRHVAVPVGDDEILGGGRCGESQRCAKNEGMRFPRMAWCGHDGTPIIVDRRMQALRPPLPKFRHSPAQFPGLFPAVCLNSTIAEKSTSIHNLQNRSRPDPDRLAAIGSRSWNAHRRTQASHQPSGSGPEHSRCRAPARVQDGRAIAGAADRVAMQSLTDAGPCSTSSACGSRPGRARSRGGVPPGRRPVVADGRAAGPADRGRR